MPAASASAPVPRPEAAHRPRPTAFPRPTPRLEAPRFFPAPRVVPRRSRRTRARAVHQVDLRSVPRPAVCAPIEAAAVPRRYIRRHPDVTGEPLLFKVACSSPSCLLLPLPPLHHVAMAAASQAAALLALLATARVSTSLGTSSTAPSHALPGVAPLSPAPQPAAAAIASHCCAPSPTTLPPQLRPPHGPMCTRGRAPPPPWPNAPPEPAKFGEPRRPFGLGTQLLAPKYFQGPNRELGAYL
jgi:hypothetical protein